MQPNSKPVDKSKPNVALCKINVNQDKAKHVFQTANIPVYSPYELYEGQKMFITYMIECFNQGKNGLVQSPTGTGKTMSLLCSSLSWIKYNQQFAKNETRIIYTSRTHAQLKQVVSQLSKTGFDVKISIMGSRDQTCINEDLKQLTGQSKELECRIRTMRKNGMFCKYFHHEQYFGKMNNLGKICDLEQLKAEGKAKEFCPFYYEKHCKNKANLILMPYTYLLEQKTAANEQIAPLIENSILIFDEAHNIPSACESSKQLTISLSVLSRALHHLSELRQQKLQEQKQQTKKKQNQPQKSLMNSSIADLQMHASFVSSIFEHIHTLTIPIEENGLVMNVHQFLVCMDNSTATGEFGKIRNKINQLLMCFGSIKADILLKPYWALQNWFNLLRVLESMYKMDVSNRQGSYMRIQFVYSGSDIRLIFYCLDPKVGFDRILKLKPRSIILTSGTLSPLNSMPIQLETDFHKPLACPHIMTKQQVNGCILTHGPNQIKLNFSYENRNNVQIYKELGFVILEILTKTPNGVIVFVPSYVFLEKIKQEFTSSGIMSKMYAKKSIFFEKQSSSDFKQILDTYLQQATKSKGAVLFALSRGKISEGLDFSDSKCRAVVLIGVPYPSSKDIKVTSKMQYLDEKSKTIKSMNGNQWYICETIRCINQSIGRIIRNKSDYGSIFLLDERFKKNDIFGQISSWARQSIKIVNNFEQFKLRLDLFQQYLAKKNQSTNNNDGQIQYFFTSHAGTKLTNKLPEHNKQIRLSTNVSKNPMDIQQVDPQKERHKLRTQMKEQIQKEKSKVEPSRQKMIFTSKAKKEIKYEIKQCPVCRVERRLIKNTECIHCICQDCWDIWLKKDLRCPICRIRIREKFLIKN